VNLRYIVYMVQANPTLLISYTTRSNNGYKTSSGGQHVNGMQDEVRSKRGWWYTGKLWSKRDDIQNKLWSKCGWWFTERGEVKAWLMLYKKSCGPSVVDDLQNELWSKRDDIQNKLWSKCGWWYTERGEVKAWQYTERAGKRGWWFTERTVAKVWLMIYRTSCGQSVVDDIQDKHECREVHTKEEQTGWHGAWHTSLKPFFYFHSARRL
jgi:hypothetical protein